MIEQQFEWDAEKSETNFAKHGVTFEAARGVFDDVFAVEWCDVDSDPGEIRYLITGTSHDVILTVVYTERADRVRIISARRANNP